MSNLNTILQFIHTTEALKKLLRHSWLSDGRRESVAEHTWRMALMAITLSKEINAELNMEKVLKMIVIHDLAEIYAGDFHALNVPENKHALEQVALHKVLQDLPQELADELYTLWQEFESAESVEAKFAQALDKLEVLIQHNQADLNTWEEKELAFSLTYATDTCSYNECLMELRNLVLEDSKKKINDSKTLLSFRANSPAGGKVEES